MLEKVQDYDIALEKTKKILDKTKEIIIQLKDDIDNLLRLACQAKQDHDAELFVLRV